MSGVSTRGSFLEKFRLREGGYLADYVDDAGPNPFIRPNMVVACALDYRMVDQELAMGVLSTVRQHLLTPRGLRSLSPRNPLYKGKLEGDQRQRDIDSKNGTVWIWPLAFYVKASFDISGRAFLPQAEEILAGFEEDIQTYCIGSVNEVYDADPPYTPRGSMSQAWSVGAILQICEMVAQQRSLSTAEPRTDAAARPAAKASAKKNPSAKPVKKAVAGTKKTTKTTKNSQR